MYLLSLLLWKMASPPRRLPGGFRLSQPHSSELPTRARVLIGCSPGCGRQKKKGQHKHALSKSHADSLISARTLENCCSCRRVLFETRRSQAPVSSMSMRTSDTFPQVVSVAVGMLPVPPG
ncbi:unnamed protein product [Prorocentrum cordatum]|uniref:Secreted protein n=1 Tax=Prorocentrum cordatum TaxID=2364126 RepID=A0ABN9T2P4_9DINO|nr:unnamed protein product [Polarella glacialis]